MYLNYRLPDIPVNPIPYPDFFLLTNMCILRCIADSEETGELISVRSIEYGMHTPVLPPLLLTGYSQRLPMQKRNS